MLKVSIKNKYSGFAIAIAWPETFCKQPGYWYDGIINYLKISKNHYYKIGHAALILIDNNEKKCHYFDFGRYHSPFQTGRVRSAVTDNGLLIKTSAEISDDGKEINNFKEIITELQLNAECHGEGKIQASYCHINFRKAFDKAIKLQELSPIPYGPFKYKGSNCSRFVNTSILAGRPDWKFWAKLYFFVPLTPTPLNNVNSLNNKIVLKNLLLNKNFHPPSVKDKSILKKTLPKPKQPEKIPQISQWLSGEGAGSWFSIKLKNSKFSINRFNPIGMLECTALFEIENNIIFDINQTYKFTYSSHCNKVSILQNQEIIRFNRIK